MRAPRHPHSGAFSIIATIILNHTYHRRPGNTSPAQKRPTGAEPARVGLGQRSRLVLLARRRSGILGLILVGILGFRLAGPAVTRLGFGGLDLD